MRAPPCGTPFTRRPCPLPPKNTGIKAACDVFYRTTASYLSRVADYHELRTASLRAAEDIHGPGAGPRGRRGGLARASYCACED